MWYNITMRNLYYVNRQSLNTDFNRNSAIGGGGYSLWAWVLAICYAVKLCVDCVLIYFIEFVFSPEFVSGFFAVKKMEDNL